MVKWLLEPMEINKHIRDKVTLLKTADKHNKFLDKICKIWTNYNMAYTELLREMSEVSGYGDQKDRIHRLVSNEGTIEDLDSIATDIEKEYGCCNELKIYHDIEIILDLNIDSVNLCDCGFPLTVSVDKTKLECYECGMIQYDLGTIADSTKNMYKYKHGNFKPNRHAKCWLDRILARENEEEIGDSKDPNNLRGEKLIEQMKDRCMRSGIYINNMTIDDGRRILKELGKTNLNKNISLIMKKLTGRSPPQPSEEIYQKVFTLFLLIMKVRESTMPSERNNRIYYPYYYYKIFDIYLTDKEERRLLGYIHLHKQPTLSANDDEWKEMCDNVPFLRGKYVPTISLQIYI